MKLSLAFVITVMLICVIPSAFAQEDPWDAAVAYLVGAGPFDVCCGDFDGINGDDFAVACDGGDYVYVYLNNGDGTFTYSDYYNAYENPRSIVTADFDGVNGLDLALVTYNNNRMIVLFNDGDGTFDDNTWNVSVGTDMRPQSIYAADFDGFNGPDIVTANAGGSSVSVFFNIGDGTFASPVNFTTGTNPGHVIAADFGGSSHPDIAVTAVVPDSVEILINNGDSTFQSPIQLPSASSPFGLDFADFDGVNGNDLVVGNISIAGVSVYLNDGAGSFAGPVTIPTLYYPRTMVCTDVDQDSNIDMVVSMFNYDSVSVLMGNGDGTFQAYENYAVGDGPFGIEDGDFDGDIYPDIAVANTNGNSVSILNSGAGSVDVDDDLGILLPDEFKVRQNFPNPFNPMTSIKYNIPARSHVTIEIYNILGQKIRTLVDEKKSAGEYNAFWDGNNSNGNNVSAGVYFYRFRGGDYTETKKMLLLK